MADRWKLSSAVARFAGPRSKAWQVADRASALERAGGDVIHLGVGDPDFDTPAGVREAAIAALRGGRTHYSPIPGEPRLRAAIAAQASRRVGKPVSPDQVVVFPGAQCALFATLLCLAEAGDEVVLLEPAYATYDAVGQAGGATMVRVPLSPGTGFALDLPRIEAAFTERTRAVLVNSPGNPAGTVYGGEDLHRLVDLCRTRGVWLVSDEVYWSLVYDGAHHSPLSAAGAEELCFLVNSLSKSHAMTGWRIGWSIAPAGRAHHLVDLAQCLLFGVTQFVQDAAAAALAREFSEVAEMGAVFRRRRDVLCDGLAAIPALEVQRPAGGMFLLLGVGRTGLDGTAFAEALLDEAGVAVVPGAAFGDSLRDWVRIGFLRDEAVLRDAVERIAAFVARRTDP